MIKFTLHAKNKFAVLARHGFKIETDLIILTIEKPELIDTNRSPLLIAQRRIDLDHVLRVVYKEEYNDLVVITFYPGRRNQYEN